MTHKEFEEFIDGLSDLDKFHLCMLMTEENMLNKRNKIWNANYKKLSKTKEWKDNMKERDSLLDLGTKLTVEQAARLDELDKEQLKRCYVTVCKIFLMRVIFAIM